MGYHARMAFSRLQIVLASLTLVANSCLGTDTDPCVQRLVESAFVTHVTLPPRLQKLREAILTDLSRHLTQRLATVPAARLEKIRRAVDRTAFRAPSLLVPFAAYVPHRRAVTLAETFRGKTFAAFVTVHEFEHLLQDLDAPWGGTVASRLGRSVLTVRSRVYVGEREAHEAEFDAGRRAIALEERVGDLERLMLYEGGVPESAHAEILDHLSKMEAEGSRIYPLAAYQETALYRARRDRLQGYLKADPHLGYLFTLQAYRRMPRTSYTARILDSGGYFVPVTAEILLKGFVWTAVTAGILRAILF